MKQVTFTGQVDKASPVTAILVEHDEKPWRFPVGVAVEVPEALAERLAADDMAHNTFEIVDAPSAPAKKKQKQDPIKKGDSSPAYPSGTAGGTP